MQVLDQVNQVIESLQEGKWADHDITLLIAAQGKLAVLLGNVNEMVANARKEMDMRDLFVKQSESEAFEKHKLQKETDAMARHKSRLEVMDKMETAIVAKHAYNSILGVLEAMRTMIIACQVTIKNIQKEREATPFVENV